MLTPEEIQVKKNKVCVICSKLFALPTIASRFGGGKIDSSGKPICNRCISTGGLKILESKRPLSYLLRTKTVAIGARYFGNKPPEQKNGK